MARDGKEEQRETAGSLFNSMILYGEAETLLAMDATTNPYLQLQQAALDQFRPNLSPHWQTRVGVLLGLLIYVIVISIALLILMAMASKRRDRPLYLYKIVTRPQGKYVILNQFLAPPLVSLGIAIVWTAYLVLIRQWWSSGVISPMIVYWLCLGTILPCLVGSWVIKFSVLSAANLATVKKNGDASQHRIPPSHVWFPVVFLSATITACTYFASQAYVAYQHLNLVAMTIYTEAGAQATSYQGSSSPAEAQDLLDSLLLLLDSRMHQSWVPFNQNYRNALICLILGVFLSFITNLAGWYRVIRHLRVTDSSMLVRQDEPIVAPLQQFTSALGDNMVDGSQMSKDEAGDEEWLGRTKREELISRGKKLDWDTLLFYGIVGVNNFGLICYATWLAIAVNGVFKSNGIMLEAECLAVLWVAVVPAAFATTAKCIVRIRQLRKPAQVARRPSVGIVDLARRGRSKARAGSFASEGGIHIPVTSVQKITYVTSPKKQEEESDDDVVDEEGDTDVLGPELGEPTNMESKARESGDVP